MPKAFSWIQYISPFNYGLQVLTINEYRDLEIDCLNCKADDLYCYTCDPLNDLGYENDFLEGALGLVFIDFFCRVISYMFLVNLASKTK